MKKLLGAILLLSVMPGAIAQASVVKQPAEAIAIADKASTNGVTGRYEMIVMSTGKNLKATFLNSTADYRGDDNLTFSISPIVAKALSNRYGMPAEEYFKGKHVVVDGVVRKRAIVNIQNGVPRSLNRIGHSVEIRKAAQIIQVD